MDAVAFYLRSLQNQLMTSNDADIEDRIRKVKCDEGKPKCHRCESTGRKCDGYGPLFRNKSPAERSPLLTESSSHSNVSSSPTPEFRAPTSLIPATPSINGNLGSLDESRSLEYFRLRTIPQLSGFLESKFWSYYVLQMAASEPTIRHAVVAIGSLHERFETGDSSILRSSLDKLEGGFALQQYLQAIGRLIGPLSKQSQQSLDVALTACVLFTCFDVRRASLFACSSLTYTQALRGHHGSALNHVSNGIKMLREIQGEEDPSQGPPKALDVSRSPYLPYDTFHVLFSRFDSQSLMLGIDNGTTSFHASEEVEPGFSDTIPLRFSTLLEARNSLDYLTRSYNRFYSTVRDNIVPGGDQDAQRRKFLSKLNCWLIAFDEFILTSPGFDNKDRYAIKILRLQYLIGTMFLATTEPYNEMMWDSDNELSSRVTDLAAQIVEEFRMLYGLNGKCTPIFSLDTGFTSILFHVARRCRDPLIRRKAIGILQRSPRQDGVWDGVLAARVAERVVQLEEGDAEVRSCTDIPYEARIKGMDVKWDMQTRRACFIYSKQAKLIEDDDDATREIISW